MAWIDEPEKNGKFSAADMEERKFWKQYMHVDEACLGATSTKNAPWYVVPADDQENARLIISQILLDTFNGSKLGYLEVDAKRREELQAIREQLMREGPSGK